MGAIDGILGVLVQNGADELRLASGAAPKMYARGAQKRLVLPATSDDTLRMLLGPLLTPDREAHIATGARAEVTYAADGGESFVVSLGHRTNESGPPVLEATFFLSPKKPVASAHASSQAAPPTPTALAPSTSFPTSTTAAEPAPLAREVKVPARYTVEEERSGPSHGSSSPSAELQALLDEARLSRASDLHLAEGSVPSLRVDGRLRLMRDAEPVSMARLLAGLPADRIAAAASGQRAYDGVVEVGHARYRLNVYRTAEGVAAAVRVLPRTAPSIAELGLPAAVGELALVPNGLVLITGPTGTGKSATLAALAQLAVQRRAALLVTLEDPIEYVIEADGSGGLVRQRQVGRDVPDFPSGLRDALREDPDLLLVGELRDSETIALALTAAETGHLVLATLHSRSAASAVERIVDACSSRRESEVRSQLAASLRAVVSQRLLPHKGRPGRVLALEILRGNHNVAGLIRDGKTAQLSTAMQSGRKEGMVPLEASLAELVRTGQVTRADAEAATADSTALAGYLAGG